MSAAQGGNFWSGALAGGISSGISTGAGRLLKNAGKVWKAVGIVGSGSVSGGIGSVLGGGNFWDGVWQGAITSGLNHLAHELFQIDRNKLKEKILKDGRLTLKEANEWYRYGNGEPLTVDANKLDLDFLDLAGWKIGDVRSVQTLTKSSDGRVYGHLTLSYAGNNRFIIATDNYGFELHRGSLNMSAKTGFKLMFRNAATNIGGAYAGHGQPFDINFHGLYIHKSN